MSGFTDPLDRALGESLRRVAFDRGDPTLVLCDANRPGPEFLAYVMAIAASKHAAESGERKIMVAAAAILKKHAEVFEFGLIPDRTLRENAMRAGPLLATGLLSTPFRACVFWYTLDPDVERAREQIAKIRAVDPEAMEEETPIRRRYASCAIRLDSSHSCRDGCTAQHFVVCDFLRLTTEEVHAMRLPPGDYLAIDACGTVSTTPDGRWEGTLLESMGERLPNFAKAPDDVKASIRQMALGSLADGVASAAMMLSTRGIKTVVEEPSAKLNAKRSKAGKSPLPRVTVVDTSAYVEASERTSRGGHHASPVPHLRRGHIRRLRTGRETWIRDMLVNCRSLAEAAPRDHYEVRNEKTE